METARVAIVFILSMLLPYMVQRWDRRRLTDEQRATAWNGASWGAAVYGFGPWSMIGWCWVTRFPWARWRAEFPAWSTFRLFRWSMLLLATGALVVPLGLAAIFVWCLLSGTPWARWWRESRMALVYRRVGQGALSLLLGVLVALVIALVIGRVYGLMGGTSL